MAGANFVTESDADNVRYIAKRFCEIPPDELKITDVGKSAHGRPRIQVEAHEFKWEAHIRKLFFLVKDYGYKTTSGSIVGGPDPA